MSYLFKGSDVNGKLNKNEVIRVSNRVIKCLEIIAWM